jgi:probable F420-dependent oxidoreductase
LPDSQIAFRFGYSGSSFGGADSLMEMAARAEQAGFDTLTLPDLPGALSPLIALAAVARATTAIGVGTFVLNTGLWDPATIARELATLDQVSGGRLEISLGSGIPQPSLRGIIPANPDARFERLRATIEALRSTFESPGISPGFVGRPRLFVAGSGDRTLRLAASEADGFIIASVPPPPKVQLPPGQLVLPEPAAAKEFLDRLRRYARDRAGHFEIGTGVEVILTDDALATAEQLAKTHTYLSPEQIRSSPKILIGSVEEIAAQILDRGHQLDLTYLVMRGAAPEELTPVMNRVRAS